LAHGGHRKKRRTGLRILLVLVVIIVAGLVVADRVAAKVTEDRLTEAVAEEARKADAAPASTDVDIAGFPFLNQVVSGKFDGGEVVFRDMKTDLITIKTVDINITELTVPRDVLLGAAPHDVIAGKLRGTATLSLTELASAIGLPGLKLTGNGNQLRFTAPVTLGQLQFQVSGSAKVQLEGSRVWLETSDLKAGNLEIPPEVRQLVNEQLNTGVNIPQLPYQLRLTSIRLNGEVVQVSAAADQVGLATAAN